MARVKAKQTTYVNGVKVVKEIEIEDNTDNPWLCGNSKEFTDEDEDALDDASAKLIEELRSSKCNG